MDVLIKINELKPELLFSEKTDDMTKLIEQINDTAKSFAFDVGKVKDRKEIASLAHKVARSKTALDELGKTHVATLKEKVKLVDAKRKIMRDELDVLKEEVRAPLTEFENREKVRVRAIKDKIIVLEGNVHHMQFGIAKYDASCQFRPVLNELCGW